MMSNDLEKNSELNRRIDADLRARTQRQVRDTPERDVAEEYTEGTKKTGRFAWVWIVLIVLAVLSLISIIFL